MQILSAHLVNSCLYMCLVCAWSLSRVWLFATPWTVAHQAPLSMGFSRHEYWSGLPFPSGDLPDPGIKPVSPASPALAGGFFTTSATWQAQEYWSGEPFPSPEDLPTSGIEPRSPAVQAVSLPSEPPGNLRIHLCNYYPDQGTVVCHHPRRVSMSFSSQ